MADSNNELVVQSIKVSEDNCVYINLSDVVIVASIFTFDESSQMSVQILEMYERNDLNKYIFEEFYPSLENLRVGR
jgi:hypothetical protein